MKPWILAASALVLGSGLVFDVSTTTPSIDVRCISADSTSVTVTSSGHLETAAGDVGVDAPKCVPPIDVAS